MQITWVYIFNSSDVSIPATVDGQFQLLRSYWKISIFETEFWRAKFPVEVDVAYIINGLRAWYTL